jgi:hypothetical protein
LHCPFDSRWWYERKRRHHWSNKSRRVDGPWCCSSLSAERCTDTHKFRKHIP